MFIEIHPDFFRETDNFELQFKRFSFKRFLSGPRDKIQNRFRKFSTITSFFDWKKPHDDFWNDYDAILAESLGGSWDKYIPQNGPLQNLLIINKFIIYTYTKSMPTKRRRGLSSLWIELSLISGSISTKAI